MIKKFFGDKAFYKKILFVAIPIMIQNGMTNFVNFLDNIMVGGIGTEQISSVAIVNQLIFVFNLCIFGAISGAGIFSAQFFGKKDIDGVRSTFRYKIWIASIITSVALVIFFFFGQDIIDLYLQGSADGGDMAVTLTCAKQYLAIIMIGLPAFMVTQIYASTLREAGETVVPMGAGVAAVIVDLVFNWLLIYGKFGFPELGVRGAAIATMMSRYIEAAIVVFWTHYKRNRFEYIKGMYRTLRVPAVLLKDIVKKGSPLLLNETLWAAGVAILAQSYSVRGLAVVAGMNISNTIGNLFNIVFFAMGDCISILVGQLLGAGKMEKAKDTDRKMITFAVLCSIVVAIILFTLAPVLAENYKVSGYTKELATSFMRIAACYIPMMAFLHSTYFTLRSGGKTIVTFLFDSVFMWVVSVPVAYSLSHYTGMRAEYIYVCVNAVDIIKCVIGFILVKKGVWLNNIVESCPKN